MTGGSPGGGWDGRGSAQGREGCLPAEPLGVVAGGDEQLCGGDRADAVGGHQGVVGVGDDRADLGLEDVGLVVEELVALGQRLQGEQVGPVVAAGDAGAGRGQGRDQRGLLEQAVLLP